MKTKFGFVLPTWDWSSNPRHSNIHGGNPVKYHEIKTLTLTAEELGFHSVFANDHIIRGEGGYILEGWTVISALSAITKTIRLGNLVLCNAFRFPQLVAKMAATLDVISDGRVELGIGSGWLEDEFIRYGLPFGTPKIRSRQLAEALDLIAKLWKSDSVSFKGKYYHVSNAICEPKPIQKPRPPILIGGGGEQLTLRIVAQFGDICNFGGSLELYRHKLAVLKQHCARSHRNFGDIEKSWAGDFIVASTMNQALRKAHNIKPQSMLLTDYISSNIIGSPKDCLEKIENYQKLGVTYFTINGFTKITQNELHLIARDIFPSLD
jgi:alkanesulfonate monooxygenase SsuD/methylene tetrahydromethanopterin reductase-like flavin-dependent oxidoreductase (luciferase family)